MINLNKNIDSIISSLKIVTVWLNNFRDEKDLQDAISKIDEVIKNLENE